MSGDSSAARFGKLLGHGKVAVIIPCHDEAATIGGVISSLRAELPGAGFYVDATEAPSCLRERVVVEWRHPSRMADVVVLALRRHGEAK